jgi:hypothetical protein
VGERKAGSREVSSFNFGVVLHRAGPKRIKAKVNGVIFFWGDARNNVADNVDFRQFRKWKVLPAEFRGHFHFRHI